jgi:nucleoside-diphosphate-sugar epimerase
LPATAYGRGKLTLNRLAETIARDNGISVAWARLFFLFGPHERKERLVPSLIYPLLRSEAAYCRNGDLARDFLYVEDAGDALVALMNSGVEGTVNVASGISVQLGDFAASIGAAMHHPDLVSVDSAGVPSGQPKTIVADVERLRREVGWTPQYDLHQGLERTITWCAAQSRAHAV